MFKSKSADPTRMIGSTLERLACYRRRAQHYNVALTSPSLAPAEFVYRWNRCPLIFAKRYIISKVLWFPIGLSEVKIAPV